MKRLFLILLMCVPVWGYDANDANLVSPNVVEITTTTSTDYLYILVDPSGTPLDRKITRNNLLDNWVGDVNVTTLGTIATGTWNGTKIDISSYTNLAVDLPIVLTGDTLSLSTATPSDGDTTHVSTADQIYDYIDSLEIAAEDPNSHDSITYDTNMATLFTLSSQVMEVNLATPANGVTKLSTADQIYDWVTGLGYLTTVDISDNTNLAGGDAITLSGDTINFDGGATPGGDLGGSWAEPSVDDDSHAHTTTTISGLDISDDTNLSVNELLTLTGDTLDANTASVANGDTKHLATGDQIYDFVTGLGYGDMSKSTYDVAEDGYVDGNNTAYNSTSWNGNINAPSMDSVRDKIESLAGGHDAVTFDTNMATIFTLTTQEIEVNLVTPTDGRDDAIPTSDDVYDFVIGLSYLSTVDISENTNLAVTAPVLLTDDTLSIDTATPSNGDTTHLSTADQIHDYIANLGYGSGDMKKETYDIAENGYVDGNDTAYNATTWNGKVDAPSMNTVRDALESLPASHDAVTFDTNMATIFSLDSQVMEVKILTPTNGSDDAIPTSDDVYDFVTGLGYLTTVDISDNTNLAAGDALSLAGDTLNFEGGATPSGDISGTWDDLVVDDDSHSHTGVTISGLDISDDTNLSVGDTATLDLTLTGDEITGDVNTTKINTTLSIDDIWTWSGLTVGDVNLPTFTGSTITDSTTLDDALQDLETALEEIDEASVDDSNTVTLILEEGSFTAEVVYQDTLTIELSEDASGFKADANTSKINTTLHIDDIWTIIGETVGDVNLGTFTGTTIPDSQTIKQALQYLETGVEEGGGGGASGSLFYTFNVFEPNFYYDTDTQFLIDPNIEENITITRINVTCDADPTTELDLDLKYADAFISLANATLVVACDTTAGDISVSSGWNDNTIDSGKCLYLEFGTRPDENITQFSVSIKYTADSGIYDYYCCNILEPNDVNDTDTNILICSYTDADLTVDQVEVTCNADPTSEPNRTLVFADDFINKANETVICEVDTTNGTADIESFTDNTVPAGKAIYLKNNAQPDADLKQEYYKIRFSYD